MTRDAKRRPHRETRRYYGDAKLVNTKIVIPEPLRDWIDDFAAKRNLSRSAVILEALEMWSVVIVDYTEEEHGFVMPQPPGQEALDGKEIMT